MSDDRPDNEEALLDAAQALFMERGYEETTAAQIEAAAGQPPGSFAARFASKRAAVEAFARRLGDPIKCMAEQLVEDQALSAVEKLNAFYDISASWKWSQVETVRRMMRGMMREDNLQLLQILTAVLAEMYQPLMTAIIAQGNAEGQFDVEVPEDTAELIMLLGGALRNTISRLVLELEEHPERFEVVERKTRLFIEATERLLGAPRGSLKRLEVGYLEAWCRSE